MGQRRPVKEGVAAVVVALAALGLVAWAFAALPPQHPRQLTALRAALFLAVAAAFVAAWAHGRASRAGDWPLKALALAVVGGCGGLVFFLLVVPGGHSRAAYNESRTLSDIRTMTSAQATYESTNGGFAEGNLDCLVRPTECLPDYPEGAPSFLEPEIASLADKDGYRRSFHPGPPPEEVPARSSPTSVTTWAFVTVPVEVGYTGMRGFCGDSRARICFTPDGTAPPRDADGLCDLSRCDGLD